jgi:hypothetical protein
MATGGNVMGAEDSWYALVIKTDDTARAHLHWLMEQSGHTTYEARDSRVAMDILRRARYRLVVLLDVEHLHVLNAATASRRLTHHHVYLVLVPDRDAYSVLFERHYPHLTVLAIQDPVDEQALLGLLAEVTHQAPKASLYA